MESVLELDCVAALISSFVYVFEHVVSSDALVY